MKFESYYTNGKGPKNWMGLLHPPTFQGRHYGTIGPNFMDLLKLPQKVPHSRRKQMDFETPSFKTPPCFMFLIISIVILSRWKFLTLVSMILAGLLWVFWCKCRSHSEIKMKLLKEKTFFRILIPTGKYIAWNLLSFDFKVSCWLFERYHILFMIFKMEHRHLSADRCESLCRGTSWHLPW